MNFGEADQLVLQTKKWSAIPRIARTVPFGYQVDPDNPDLLQPVLLELEALEKAKKHLKQWSYRDVADWLSTVSGRYISHVGLKKRIDNERKRKSAARFFEQWADRSEKARAKAQRLYEECLGAGEDISGAD